MEIAQERLEQEFDLDVIMTAPSVLYKIIKTDDEIVPIDSPSRLPDRSDFKAILEPFVRLELVTPTEFIGPLMDLSQSRRGKYIEMNPLSAERALLIYHIPLSEVIVDFFDVVKSKTKGYASMSFQDIGYKEEDLVRVDIKINGAIATPLSSIVHRLNAEAYGRGLCDRLKELIPRHQFKVSIQACIGQRAIAAAVVSPVMKDVLAKMSGGDYSRKKKLLQKQARGKKRMKTFGKVSLSQDAFMALIKR
jgi:elongation factor 4